MTEFAEIEEELLHTQNFVSAQHLFFCMDALLPVMIRPYAARMMVHCPNFPENQREATNLQRGSPFVDGAGDVVGTCLRDTTLLPFQLEVHRSSSDSQVCEIRILRQANGSPIRNLSGGDISFHLYGAQCWEWYALLSQQCRIESCIWIAGEKMVENHQTELDTVMPGGEAYEQSLMPWGHKNSWERMSDFFLFPEAFCSFRIKALKEHLCPNWDTIKIRLRFMAGDSLRNLPGAIPISLSMVPVAICRNVPLQPLHLRDGSTRLPLLSENPEWQVVAVDRLYWRKQDKILSMENDLPWGNKAHAQWSQYDRQGHAWLQLSPREGVFRKGEFITGTVWEIPAIQQEPFDSIPANTDNQSTCWHARNLRWQPISTLHPLEEALSLQDCHHLWEIWQKTGELENSVNLWPAWFAYLGRNHVESRTIQHVSLHTGVLMHRGDVRNWRRYRCTVNDAFMPRGMLYCFGSLLCSLLKHRSVPGELIHLSLLSEAGETLWENGKVKTEATRKAYATMRGNKNVKFALDY